MTTQTPTPTRRTPALLPALALLASMAVTPQGFAESGYIATWNGIYPGSASANNAGCFLCHGTGTGNLNAYGAAMCSASGGVSARIQAVGNMDSDADPTGSSNITEINANTQPGWTPGNVNPLFNRGNCQPQGITAAPPAGIGALDPQVVVNQPPLADSNGPYSGTVGAAVTFDGSASSDPDGSIVSYDWDFGDGNTGTGVSPTHAYAASGTFTVMLTVTDDGGLSDSASTTATIGQGNQPPQADPNGPYSGTVGVAVAFDGTGSTDPDGSIVSYAWDFGDGSSGTGASPSHSYAAEGVFNVILTVTDDAGATASAMTTAHIGPVAPPPGAGVDLDIKKLKVGREHVLGEDRAIKLKLEVINRGSVEAPRQATVVGRQNGAEVYRHRMMVHDALSRGKTTFKFPGYLPTQLGTIHWTATIEDDDPDADLKMAETRVIAPQADDDDEDRDHDDSDKDDDRDRDRSDD